MSPNTRVPEELAESSFLAMGTVITVMASPQILARATARVRAIFWHWEKTLSRFRRDSELSRLNRHGGQPVRVGGLLWEVLQAALAAAESTGGVFDPTLAVQIEAIGYRSNFDTMAKVQPAATVLAQPGGKWREIDCNPVTHRVTLPPDCSLDFGGIAKGMAVDAALRRLAADRLTPALVNAGGDLAVLGVPPDLGYWPIAVSGLAGKTVGLKEGALATSGTEKRHWLQGEAWRHHLINPATGLPGDSQLETVTVLAAQCAQADVAAKVAWILGVDSGSRFLQEHGLSGLFRARSGDQWRAGRWPEDRRDP